MYFGNGQFLGGGKWWPVIKYRDTMVSCEKTAESLRLWNESMEHSRPRQYTGVVCYKINICVYEKSVIYIFLQQHARKFALVQQMNVYML